MKRSTSRSEAKQVEEESRNAKEESKRGKRNANEEILKKVTFLLSDVGNQYYKVETSATSLSPDLISSTCLNVGMSPVCSTSTSSSTSSAEACMLTTVSQATFVETICSGSTSTSCEGPSTIFLFSEARAVCLDEALGGSATCPLSGHTLQTSFALCVTPAGECHTS